MRLLQLAIALVAVCFGAVAAHAGGSFPVGTKVLTETGFRAIETLAVGDRVMSYNPDTGGLEPMTILRRAERVAAVVEVQFDDYNMRVTPDHPFLTPEGWRRVVELQVGNCIFDADGGAHVIRAIINRPGQVEVHNLTVDVLGNFLVTERRLVAH